MDIGISASFAKIFSTKFLKSNNSIFNIHLSLLPELRGPSPVETAILNNYTTTGFTVFHIDEDIDTGRIIFQKTVSISKADMQTGTYEDITNSGNLNLLTDFLIKKQIVDYHVTMAGVEFIDNYFYKYFGDFVMPFIFTNFNE